MQPISHVLRDMLVRQGMSVGSAGTGRAKRVASAPVDGEEERQRQHSPTAGEETRPIGMGKRTPAEPAPVVRDKTKRQQTVRGYSGEPFLWLIADNVDVVPTRQRRGIARLSLVRT